MTFCTTTTTTRSVHIMHRFVFPSISIPLSLTSRRPLSFSRLSFCLCLCLSHLSTATLGFTCTYTLTHHPTHTPSVSPSLIRRLLNLRTTTTRTLLSTYRVHTYIIAHYYLCLHVTVTSIHHAYLMLHCTL
ncbi:hypothetical protein DFH08DRAFT_10346 [Mycena albidolilacea]|uniref:Uncharacterized protein n=1 Tax=Mycena albidolilacea TaxID=1033008 RepID=A0AAD7F6C8_9AGAR|nr:hypothetical protein DFH08DRAFT_10346 [Mycena albidolilacea]